MTGLEDHPARLYLADARRRAARADGLPADAPFAPFRRGVVIGGGLMGRGIALALLGADIEVLLVEPSPAVRQSAQDHVRAVLVRDRERGRISVAQQRRRAEALSILDHLPDDVDADLFIEAVPEDLAIKQSVFGMLDRVARPGSLLASNSSSLDLDLIASVTRRPGDVVGLHFFSPAHVMRLLEIVEGAETAPQTVARALAFAGQIGKSGVVSRVCDGFIGNRMFEEYLRQAWFLLEEGATPWEIDGALDAFGMAMGPCRVMDLAGQDIGYAIRRRRAIEQPGRPYGRVPDLLCEQGRLGQKSGRGFYDYGEARQGVPDPAVLDLILEESRRLGLARRTISSAEIVERCILALVNEAAHILSQGIARRPSDIDVVYADGYGFPQHLGGPLYHADQLGLDAVVEALKAYSGRRQGWALAPAPLLVDLAGQGRTLASLNQD